MLKTKAKHGLTGLALTCAMFPGVASARNNTKQNDNNSSDSIKTTVVSEPIDTLANQEKQKTAYFDIEAANLLGAQMAGKQLEVKDKAELGFATGFEKNQWFGEAKVKADLSLSNKSLFNADLTNATVKIGKTNNNGSAFGLEAGRTYTENFVLYGPVQNLNLCLDNDYCSNVGNLSDKLNFFFTKNGFSFEAGVIEKADSSFYLSPNVVKADFWGKVSFNTKTNKNVNVSGTLATELGYRKNVLANLGVYNEKFGVLFGGKMDFANYIDWNAYITGRYTDKNNISYIITGIKYCNYIYIQAGIEKKNIMVFVGGNLFEHKCFNAGLAWKLAYNKRVR
nr:hypothetical protein [Candidatus Enterousia merdequi]